MPYEPLLNDFVALFQRVCGDALTGVYLHGSLATGCFTPEKSDIDLLAVVETPLPDAAKRTLMEGVVRLNGQAPAKGIEMSVLLAADCAAFQHPMPFLLHFSPAHLAWYQQNPKDYIAKMNGTDPDLAAHITVLHQRGVVLSGRGIHEVFAPVPREAYIDSIWRDVENAREDILRDPLYMTLNLCRVMACVRDGCCLSKKEGAEWGLTHLPEGFHGLIREAADCYASDRPMRVVHPAAPGFADWMLAEIRREMGF